MKRAILNLGAIIVAFFIGLAINSACADSLEKMTDSELRTLVSQLQQEVNSLKQRVAQLETQISNVGTSSPATGVGFDVDGIHFDNMGFPEDRIDYTESSSYYIINGVRTDNPTTTSQYEYDSKGRIIKQGINIYSYSGRTYKSTYDSQNENSTTHSEITYHLK